MSAPTVAVLEYHLTGYRRTWRGSALSSFVLPLLTMLGFGVGVGSYVQPIDGVPYLDWMVPGLIASTAVNVAIGDSTWPVFGGFEWIKIYFAQAAAPLRVVDIVGGHLAFVVFRVLISGTAFLVVATLFGAVPSPWALASLPVIGLLGSATAPATMAYSATIKADSYLALLFRFGVIPMSLFSGVFFPIDSLHWVLRALAYALPLWHGVDLVRAATLGAPPQWSVTGHLIVLASWAVVGWWLALDRFGRRLVI
jgi:lipooligosaccharide transport system permease protein